MKTDMCNKIGTSVYDMVSKKWGHRGVYANGGPSV